MKRNGYMIENLPDYAEEYEFVVATAVDDEFWFYGAYANEEKALAVANEVGGIVC